MKVLTGDNEQVARHLCGELGFDPGQVLTGTELTALSDEALIGRLAATRLFCRVTPQQKLRVIMALKRWGKRLAFSATGSTMPPPFTRRMSVSLSIARPMSPRRRRKSSSLSRIWAWCTQA